jgi:hypothetical protein
MTYWLGAIAIAWGLLTATGAQAGAPGPETRAQVLSHVCKGGANKDLPCDPTLDQCPEGTCEIDFVSKTITGTLTVIYDDFVLDWEASAGPPPVVVGGPRALTLMLEVKAGGETRLLTETYQNTADVTQDPGVDPSVMNSPITEGLLLVAPLNGLLTAHPELTTMGAALRSLFSAPADSIPVLIGFSKKQVTDDHTGDQLGTVARRKVKLRFATLAP